MEQKRMEIDLASYRPGGNAPSAAGISQTEPGLHGSARESLQEIAWLRGIPPKTLDALAAQAVLHRVPTGSLLFEQAEIPVFAQFLLAGS